MNVINLNCLRLSSAASVIPASLRVSSAMGFSTSSSPFYPSSFVKIPQRPLVAFAKKNNSDSEAALSPSIVEEVFMDGGEEDDVLLDGIHFFFFPSILYKPLF